MYKDKSSVNESCSSTSSDNSTKTVLITSPLPGPSSLSTQQNISAKIDATQVSLTNTKTAGTPTPPATIIETKTSRKPSTSSFVDSSNSINLLTSSSENLSSLSNTNQYNQHHHYQKPSTATSAQSDDISLITDIGYIASQVRYLENKYAKLNNQFGPYDYHKELEKYAITLQQQHQQFEQFRNTYKHNHQQPTGNFVTTAPSSENVKYEYLTKSKFADENSTNVSSIQPSFDDDSKEKFQKNSLEIESLGPLSNLIKQQTEKNSLQQQQKTDNTQQAYIQQQQHIQQQQPAIITTIASTSTTTILTESTILSDAGPSSTTTHTTNITNILKECSKVQRTELLEELLIKFYKCQEDRIRLQEQIEYQKEIDRRFPKKIYIMSCGSIEKLLSLDDQKNLNNINYNNNRKPSLTSQQTNSNNITTTDDNQQSFSSTAVNISKYYAGSKLFPTSITTSTATLSSSTPASCSTSPCNNIKLNQMTPTIFNNCNNKLIPSPQNTVAKQCSRSSGSLNSSNYQDNNMTNTQTVSQTTPAANRTIGIIKQQSIFPSNIQNVNRRSSSSIVENRTSSHIHDLKAELLNNSRKYSVGTLTPSCGVSICAGSSAITGSGSSINTDRTISSQSSFKSAASSVTYLKNDNNYLTATPTKSSPILSRSSGNVHFKDDEKTSADNGLLHISNDKKSGTIFKSTGDIISHCGTIDYNPGGGSSSSTSENKSDDSIIKYSNSQNYNRKCSIERKDSYDRTNPNITASQTTIVCSDGNDGSKNSDSKNQKNNLSNNNNENSDNNNGNLNNINNNVNNSGNCGNSSNNFRKDSSGSSGSKGSEINFIQLQNTMIQCQINSDDLKTVVGDLKRKIDYTEKMNWLCLSKRPIGPPHRKTSIPKHSEVKKRFLEICDKTLPDDIKAALRLPAFDSYDWEDADVIYLMQTMFIELGLVDKFNIPMDILREWLYEIYKHYNEVPFHNFRHCFCVAQMMFAITHQANLCQRLGELEVLILLVSCICHDLDHPGYNNIYQINARTELALRYNDISPLENHHCSIAFRLLEHPDCNIFKNFSRDTFNFIREGIIRCILATDMARHNEILTQFKEILPCFDYSNRSHINLLCMVLIKVADISNEARPMEVAEPWLDRLLAEFFAQSAAEKSEGLPVTPFMDPDKITKPGSQVRFIGLVLLPLFEALGELLPEIIDLIIVPVRIALDYYKCLNDAQNRQRKSIAEANPENGSDTNGSCSPQIPRSQSGISVKSRRSIPSQKSASRTSVDEPTCIAAELHDLPEGSESGDSETATEVDVAEKTSKFKVDTESGNRSKVSHSTCHRKSHREKRPSMISEMCSSGGRMRNSYGNIHGYHSNRGHFSSNRAVSLDQYSCNNRRSSDGLQQVISDSYVFYNRQNEALQSQQNSSGSNSTPASDKAKNEQHGVIIGEDVTNINPSQMYCDQLLLRQMSLACHSATTSIGSVNQSHLQQNLQQSKQKQLQSEQTQTISTVEQKITTDIVKKDESGEQSNQTQKSWRARFKQITEIFSIFDKGIRRVNTVKNGSDASRNNNTTTESKDIAKQGLCCTVTNSYYSSNSKQKQLKHQQSQFTIQQSEIVNIGRNRAYSLDVPSTTFRQQRYSSSSGGESRKSSRNEDSSNRQDVFIEDNNSYNTSSGEGPPIRISGGDSSDGIMPISSQPLPKVITPTCEETFHESSSYFMSSEQHHNNQLNDDNGAVQDPNDNISSNKPNI